MSSSPKVSVIMGAYNASKTLDKAVQSIIDQSFSDWEFIICDDGSGDNTWELLQQYKKDPRFVLLKNEKNKGLAGTLNECLKVARGEFVARQDADDTSTPDRFQAQLDYFNLHPNVDVLSTNANLVSDEDGVWGENVHDEIPARKDWAKGSQIIHASVMMKRDMLKNAEGYDPVALRVEDYDLWMRIVAMGGEIRTLQKKLYNIQWGRKDYRRKKVEDRLREIKYKINGIRILGLGATSYIYVLKTAILLIVPSSVLFKYHQIKMSKRA